MQCPRTSHLDARRRIMCYIKGSVDYGLMHRKCDDFLLTGFIDADWGRDINNRHSTSGYYFSNGSAVVSWCSRKQSVTTLSKWKQNMWQQPWPHKNVCG